MGNLPYWKQILNFIELRHAVTHLKTATEESDFKSYDSIYKQLLDFEYEVAFQNVKKLMKEIYE